jgi:hypothetical protein
LNDLTFFAATVARERERAPRISRSKKGAKDAAESVVSDDDGNRENEMLSLQRAIGNRLSSELPIERGALPPKIAELLRLLELKEKNRLDGH